jgi:hydroxypyruvate reductase
VTVEPRAFLRGLYDAAVAAALPATCLPAHLPGPPRGRTIVIGAGKAAAAMAQVVEERWRGAISGIVVTRYGHGAPCRRIEVIEAGHPLPDDAGAEAARRILALVGEAHADDLVLCLLSGGGSALLAAPAPGLTLDDEREITRALLARGATIAEINCVRKHLSSIKGGRLALACGAARVHALAISDVPGDDPAIIASGPTLADATSSADARSVLARYDVAVPPRVATHLRSAASETPKPGDTRLARSDCVVVARAQDALDAASRTARAAGVTPVILGDRVEGEAREVARKHAELVRELLERGAPARSASARREGAAASLPCVLLSGGETTVTVRGPRAGRAQRRISPGAGRGARWRAGRPRDRLRHGRHRRDRGQCGRYHDLGHDAPGARRGFRRRSRARRQRQLRLLRRARRSRDHGPDADQCERLRAILVTGTERHPDQ